MLDSFSWSQEPVTICHMEINENFIFNLQIFILQTLHCMTYISKLRDQCRVKSYFKRIMFLKYTHKINEI